MIGERSGGDWGTKGRKAERLIPIPIPPLFNISCVFSVSFDSFWLGFLFFSFSLSFWDGYRGAKGWPGLLGLFLGTYTWIGGLHHTTAFFFCFFFFFSIFSFSLLLGSVCCCYCCSIYHTHPILVH